MKLLSKIFYIIGFIFSLIAFITSIVYFIQAIGYLVAGTTSIDFNGQAISALALLLATLYLLLISGAITALAYRGFKYAGKRGHNGIHVLNLILGIFGVDPFFFLGGLFGLLAE